MKQFTKPNGRLQLSLLGFPSLLCLAIVFVACQQPEKRTISITTMPTAPTAQPTAAAAAEAWLSLVDRGEYAKSWEAGADIFHEGVMKDQWVASLKSVRQPLGKLISRKTASVKEMESMPGLPPGTYWIGEFDSSFSGLEFATETAILTKETNNEWKAAGYLITPAGRRTR